VLFAGLKSVLFPKAPFAKPFLFYGAKELLQSRSENDDDTVDSFFSRRFGHEVQTKMLGN